MLRHVQFCPVRAEDIREIPDGFQIDRTGRTGKNVHMKQKRLLTTPLLLFLIAFPLVLSGEELTHRIEKGETLYSISRRYHVPVPVIMESNRLKDPDRLLPGMSLVIPDVHVVRKGETLYRIARDYGISLSELVEVNGLSNEQLLKVGDRLYVPVRSSGTRTDLRPVTVEAVAAGPAVAPAPAGPHYWPIDGERSFQDGKLPRVQIQGAIGTPVHSVAGGRVVWTGPWRGFGNVVFVQSTHGYIYIYGGAERVLVRVGETVDRGAEIGTLGYSVTDGSPQLYFFVYKDGKPIHPEKAPRG